MKALIIGGTGIISTDVSKLAVERGWDVTLLNRGQRPQFVPEGAKVIEGDARDEAQIKALIKSESFDVVANFIGFKPEFVEQDTRVYAGKCGQYLYISSIAAYQKPSSNFIITESTPLKNPYWQYGRDKIACEETLMRAYREQDFPVTIVRPGLTYNKTIIPFIANCWPRPWTMIDRMQKGQPILLPGDGTSLFTMTHARDFAKGFVGLMGNQRAIGQPFHITTDEACTWNQYLEAIEAAAGLKANAVHVATDYICKIAPSFYGDLVGDKIQCTVFDNSKIKHFVPDFCATTPFALGVRECLDYFRAHPELQVVDAEYSKMYDDIFKAYGI